MAYTRGHDLMPQKTSNGIVKNQGRWLDVWKKVDEQWKVVVLISSEIPPEGYNY